MRRVNESGTNRKFIRITKSSYVRTRCIRKQYASSMKSLKVLADCCRRKRKLFIVYK